LKSVDCYIGKTKKDILIGKYIFSVLICLIYILLGILLTKGEYFWHHLDA